MQTIDYKMLATDAEKIDAINTAFKELDQNLKAIERYTVHGNA